MRKVNQLLDAFKSEFWKMTRDVVDVLSRDRHSGILHLYQIAVQPVEIGTSGEGVAKVGDFAVTQVKEIAG